MAEQLPIPIPMDEIRAFCRKHHIRKMWLYGSVLTPRFASESDVDIMVDFEEGKTPGWSFSTLHEELEPLWGHQADLSTPKDFRSDRRNQVLAQARVIYGN